MTPKALRLLAGAAAAVLALDLGVLALSDQSATASETRAAAAPAALPVAPPPPPSTEADAADARGGVVVPKTNPRPTAGPTTAPTTKPASTPAQNQPPFPLDVTITPSCAELGSSVVIELRTEPSAAVALAGVDSGGQNVGAPHAGEADATGSLRVRWLISPTATVGTAFINVIASGYGEGRNATRQPKFNIAAKGGC